MHDTHRVAARVILVIVHPHQSGPLPHHITSVLEFVTPLVAFIPEAKTPYKCLTDSTSIRFQFTCDTSIYTKTIFLTELHGCCLGEAMLKLKQVLMVFFKAVFDLGKHLIQTLPEIQIPFCTYSHVCSELVHVIGGDGGHGSRR